MGDVIFEIKHYGARIVKITAVHVDTGLEIYQNIAPNMVGTPSEMMARRNLLNRMRRQLQQMGYR